MEGPSVEYYYYYMVAEVLMLNLFDLHKRYIRLDMQRTLISRSLLI